MDQGGVDTKNECDSTRNGDTLHSGDEDSNHRCEIIETKPVSLNAGQSGDGNDSSAGSLDAARMSMGFGDMGGGGGGGMGGNGLGGALGGGGGGGGNPSWELIQLGRLREAFGSNAGNPGSSGFFNGIFANALGGGAAGKMNSLMTAAGFPGSAGGGGNGGGGGFPSPGPSNQLPGIAQSFSNAPAWAAGSMDMSNLFRNRTQFSDEQVAVLKAYYDVDKYPNAMRVAEIAAKIGVHVRVVNVWFQNSRAKEKRNMKWPQNVDPNFPPPASGPRQ